MTTQLMNPIGANLKRLRKEAGLSQQELAVAAGLSVSIVSQLEQGMTANPRADTLIALSGVLKATVDDLLCPPQEAGGSRDGDGGQSAKKPPSKGRRKKG